jgi:hypothetical protein
MKWGKKKPSYWFIWTSVPLPLIIFVYFHASKGVFKTFHAIRSAELNQRALVVVEIWILFWCPASSNTYSSVTTDLHLARGSCDILLIWSNLMISLCDESLKIYDYLDLGTYFDFKSTQNSTEILQKVLFSFFVMLGWNPGPYAC